MLSCACVRFAASRDSISAVESTADCIAALAEIAAAVVDGRADEADHRDRRQGEGDHDVAAFGGAEPAHLIAKTNRRISLKHMGCHRWLSVASRKSEP